MLIKSSALNRIDRPCNIHFEMSAENTATPSPAKPWQRPGSASTAATPATSVATPAGTTSASNVTHPTGYGTSAYGTGYGGSTYGGGYGSSMGGYGSSYGGGYGSTMGGYGSSYGGYGSSYGGYGSTMGGYGSRYGGGMGMYRSGGYGMGGGMAGYGQPGGPMQGPGAMGMIENSVHTVGRFSELMHMNLEAFQMSFSSIIQLLTNAAIIRREFGDVSEFSLVQFILSLYNKLRRAMSRLLSRMMGSPDTAQMDFLYERANAKNAALDGPRRTSWTTSFLLFAIGLWLLKKLFKVIAHLAPDMQHPQVGNQSPHGGLRQQPFAPHNPQETFDPNMQW